MNIVTGYTGTPHVTSNEAQALNQGIFGSDNYVLNIGNKFSATLVDANTITIEDGEGVMQGVQFRIAPGDTEDVNIESGTSGYNRIDLICARYTKNASTGAEAVNLVVIQGTPNASTPSTPSYNTGDILTGSTPVDYPLYKVTLTGLTPTVESLMGYGGPAVYELPCAVNATYDDGSKLYVIPSVKLMIFNVRATIPANTSSAVNLANNVPLIRGASTLLYEMVRYPMAREASGTILPSDVFATVRQAASSPTSAGVWITAVSNASSTTVTGTIVAPYTDYDSNYPLSSGTLLS